MIIRAILLVALFGTAEGVAGQTDVFEITFTQHGVHGSPTGVIYLEADELEVPQCCTITLRQGQDAVATFQSHQISLVVNRSAGGERSFELFHSNGEKLHVQADRMVPSENGLVYFHTRGRVVGVTNQSYTQVVIDAGARVDADGRPVHRLPSPVRRDR